MIITKTPYRLSLFGGGTDYPEWFSENRSQILTSSIQRFCYISVRKLPPFFPHKSRIVYSEIENVSSNADIRHPSVRATLNYFGISDGLEIHYDGDLPSKSGIGSSSAFTVGLIIALNGMRGESVDKKKLADEAIDIEQRVIGENVGIQDQIAVAYGGLNIITAGPEYKWIVEELVVSDEYKNYIQSNILMGYSGKARFANQLAEEKIRNIKEGKSINALEKTRSLTKEAIDLLVSQADISEIGNVMMKSWDLKKTLSKSLSDPEMAQLIETGIKAGALGGKLMGAGGGGFFYFIAPKNVHDKIRKSLSSVNVWVPIVFEEQGAQIIYSEQKI